MSGRRTRWSTLGRIKSPSPGVSVCVCDKNIVGAVRSIDYTARLDPEFPKRNQEKLMTTSSPLKMGNISPEARFLKNYKRVSLIDRFIPSTEPPLFMHVSVRPSKGHSLFIIRNELATNPMAFVQACCVIFPKPRTCNINSHFSAKHAAPQ